MKPAVLALIDELDKLRQPLAQAVPEELFLLTYDYVTDDATNLLGEWLVDVSAHQFELIA